MKRDICIIPCWDRPEFLWACCERLFECREIDSVRLLFALDNHAGQEPAYDIDAVVESFRRPQDMFIQCEPHPWRGNSCNVLNAIAAALELEPQFIFLVEDDVMVADDFLRWHYAVQREEGVQVSVACRKPGSDAPASETASLEAYYTSVRDYASLGVCLREGIATQAVGHARTEYFADMTGYCCRHWPGSKIAAGMAEQDGVIQRIIEAGAYPVAWPCVPRAFHCGWIGYNRSGGTRLDGTFFERVETLHSMLNDRAALNALADPRWRDIEPCALSGNEWKELHRVPLSPSFVRFKLQDICRS